MTCFMHLNWLPKKKKIPTIRLICILTIYLIWRISIFINVMKFTLNRKRIFFFRFNKKSIYHSLSQCVVNYVHFIVSFIAYFMREKLIYLISHLFRTFFPDISFCDLINICVSFPKQLFEFLFFFFLQFIRKKLTSSNRIVTFCSKENW